MWTSTYSVVPHDNLLGVAAGDQLVLVHVNEAHNAEVAAQLVQQAAVVATPHDDKRVRTARCNVSAVYLQAIDIRLVTDKCLRLAQAHSVDVATWLATLNAQPPDAQGRVAASRHYHVLDHFQRVHHWSRPRTFT